jgi:uncharacterized protein (DUF58 family)
MAALTSAKRPAAPERLVEQVFAPGILGALERVRLRVSHASGERPGHTRVRGRDDASGAELERHRPYAPGDDLRRIDWNVYARLGELLTRRFVAEREVPVWILIDRSGSMGPEGTATKLDTAAALAAILATVSLSGGDRLYVGATPGRRSALESCGPLRGRQGLGQLKGFLTALSIERGAGDLTEALVAALHHVRRGLVVLISDFLMPIERIAPALDIIQNRRCEGKLVQVLSREDRDPAWLRGQDRLVDRETGETRVIEPSLATWRRYEELLEGHLAALHRESVLRGMSSTVTITDKGLAHFLRDELPRLGLKLVR